MEQQDVLRGGETLQPAWKLLRFEVNQNSFWKSLKLTGFSKNV